MTSVEIPSRVRWAGAAFVTAATGFQILWLGLPAMFVSIGLIASFSIWVSSNWRIEPALRTAFLISIIVFICHAIEEFAMGLQSDLPALFGRAEWSDGEFLTFNSVWMLIFCIAAFFLRPGRSLPVLIVLFFALLGGVGNGIFHLLLVLQRGGYFPGAWTAPFCLVAGIWLLRLLYSKDRSVAADSGD